MGICGPHRGAGRTSGANYNDIFELLRSAPILKLKRMSANFGDL